MAGINRTNSPMNLYRDDYLETKEELDKAKEAIIDEQNQKPSFLVGSIERVNERIANLDRELQMFASSLVIESQGSNVDDDDYFYPSTQDTYGPVKARDVKELNQFAGIYSVKSTLTADQTNKGKYLAKRIKTSKMKKKETKATKPKLVELYQFRGFDNKKLTPLPDLDSAIIILMRVTDAQRSLDKKPHYKEEFKRLFHSKMSEAVLVDSFWWFFLNRYHPSKMVQPKLFNRIAHNYVKLLLSANHPKYRDVFFQGYADLLAQGMYAAFCAAFPDSWRQFQGDFISGICDLTGLWIVGTKPAPESWKGAWNFEKLEPKDLRKEEILKQDSKKGNILNLDFSENDISRVDTNSTLALSEQYFSLIRSSKTDKKTRIMSPSNTSISSSMTRDHLGGGGGGGGVNKDETSDSIDAVALAQTKERLAEKHPFCKSTPLQPIKEHRVEYEDSMVSDGSSSSRNPKGGKKKGQGSKVVKQPSDSLQGGVPSKAPNKSVSEDRSLHSSKKSSSHAGLAEVSRLRKSKESHPVSEGPTFAKCIFNSSGQSPLVKHFLQKQGLQKRAGTEILLQRTEIDQLPPSDSQTYQDVIHDSFQSVRYLDESYKKMFEDGLKEHTHFIKQQKRQLKEHMRRENSLMSRPREVKRLSDLLVLELLKDPDEVNTGAAQAVEEALLQQDEEIS